MYNPSMKQAIQRALLAKQERKYLETALVGVDLPNTGSITNLNSVAEGTDFNNRLGRKVKPLYLQYEYFITATAGQIQNTPVAWRFVFVWDKQANGANPTVAQVLDTSVIGVTNAMKNISLYSERFKILKEERGSVFNGGMINTVGSGFLKLDHFDDVQWSAAAAGVPNTGGLLVLYASNEAATNNVIMSLGTRFCYTDA